MTEKHQFSIKYWEIHDSNEIIQQRGIIFYPTDMVWSIGCYAKKPEAVIKTYNLKKRGETQIMICLMNDEKMMYTFSKTSLK